MQQRLITAAVVIPLAFVTLYLGSPISVIVGLLLYACMQYEYSRFAVTVRRRYQNAYWILSLGLPIATLYAGYAGLAIAAIALSLAYTCALICIVEREADPVPFESLLSAVAIGIFYLGLLGSLLPLALHQLPPLLCIWTVVVIGFCDSAAYFGGSYFQGPKLAPRISPKKTVSGLISGIVFSVAAAGALGYWLFPSTPLYVLLLTVFLLSVVSVFGDLTESLLKRMYQVKDSGSLLPGHGGVLDRIDGLLFAVPVMLLIHYLTLFVV